ncbi:uncharacterized protein [Epargyreus clarus]|uniref:uncharacterized protein n=1 Tax=Epargyreus clarus TaxID=520877 RepID=UPI003C30833B
MKQFGNFILLISLWALVWCSPYDDGKYKRRNDFDDGKYYRPLDEGKYVPGDEGKYTYIYTQGVWPFDGTYKHLELGDSDDYIGFKIYAPRFPYIHNVIKALINKYVSPDSLIYEESESGDNYFNKIFEDNEVALKCNILSPEGEAKNETEIITTYPPQLKVEKGEKLGSIYSFKGTKVLSTVKNALTNKLKLEYEVIIRVVEDVTE